MVTSFRSCLRWATRRLLSTRFLFQLSQRQSLSRDVTLRKFSSQFKQLTITRVAAMITITRKMRAHLTSKRLVPKSWRRPNPAQVTSLQLTLRFQMSPFLSPRWRSRFLAVSTISKVLKMTCPARMLMIRQNMSLFQNLRNGSVSIGMMFPSPLTCPKIVKTTSKESCTAT